MNETTLVMPIVKYVGWADEDFYKLKLVLDRVSNIGFSYYIRHWGEALRDFRLYLRFRNLKPKQPKPRPDLKFGKKNREVVRKDVKNETVTGIDPVKAKMKKAYDLALFMQASGIVGESKEALDAQVDVMLKYSNEELASYELVTRKMIEDLKRKK